MGVFYGLQVLFMWNGFKQLFNDENSLGRR